VGAVKDFKLYTRISRAINGYFGTTGPGTARISTQSVKLHILDEELLSAKFQMIVTIGSFDKLEKAMPRYEKEALAMIEATLNRAIDSYKELFPDEKPIKFKIKTETADDNVEFVQSRQLSGMRRGFYRLTVLVGISE
jgi:hypothetical protein